MSTTSTNFAFVLATTSDQVDVMSHISNNFNSLDSIVGVAHTGTGQLKTGLSMTTPTLVNPVVSGTMTGGNIIATTANFQTITATGGTITANTFAIGTYSLPSTIGASGDVLTVSGGNAVFLVNSPGTGANNALSNLASVAVNTNLNTFTAGFVTVARVIATSGALTGLTSFQATTGTFAGNVLLSATLTANAVVCTGGVATFATFSIGTCGYPATGGSTGQLLSMSGGNAVWGNVVTTSKAYIFLGAASTISTNGATIGLVMTSTLFNVGVGLVMTGTALRVDEPGYYQVNGTIWYQRTTTTGGFDRLWAVIGTTSYLLDAIGVANNTTQAGLSGGVVAWASSGEFMYLGLNPATSAYSMAVTEGTYNTYMSVARLPG